MNRLPAAAITAESASPTNQHGDDLLFRHDGPERTPPPPLRWPAKVEVMGVGVSRTDYAEAAETIVAASRQRQSAVVSCHPVAGIVAAMRDAELRRRVNSFEMITPDGQPVRWAMNWLRSAGLRERVYGPQLMLEVCRRAAACDVGVYLYGATPEVVERLKANLAAQFPGLKICGAESPPFRPLTPEEDAATVERFNRSGAGIVFLGLGCPKQDHFAYEHRSRVRAVQICVGAAFDFHAGVKPMAPRWMQRSGLEWLFRLWCEPRRLWRRYLGANSYFALRLAYEWVRCRVFRCRSLPLESADSDGGSVHSACRLRDDTGR